MPGHSRSLEEGDELRHARNQRRSPIAGLPFPCLLLGGGKRGHSNMNHRVTTEEIKVASRKGRRLKAQGLMHRVTSRSLHE